MKARPATALLAVVVACGTSDRAPATTPSDTSVDAGVAIDAAATADAAPPAIAPYPPGPYGGGIGEVLPNFTIRGYALSPTERDSTRLPFREISLAEVRSNPACKCVAIIHTGCGTQCGPCLNHDRTMTMLVSERPDVCVVEVLSFNYDGNDAIGGNNAPNPPTRADVDAFTQSGRENYPVGIPTQSAMRALTDGILNAIPVTLVLRASDMRFLAYVEGSVDKGGITNACNAEPTAPTKLATGVSPRKLALDDSYVYATDWNAGVYRVLRALGDGGLAREPVAKREAIPDALALDATDVYFLGRASTYSEIAHAPKTGGLTTVLATSPHEMVDLALDDTHAYYTLADGSIVRVPKAGGATEALVSGEASPTDLDVDTTHVYWIATGSGDVARAPKSGGARELLATTATLPNQQRAHFLALVGEDVIVLSRDNSYSRIPKVGGAAKRIAGIPSANAFGFDISRSSRLVIGTRHPETHVGIVALGSTTSGRVFALTPGQENVSGIVRGGPDVVWIVNADDVSANKGEIRKLRSLK